MHYKTLKVVSSNLKKYFYKCLYFTGQVGAFGQKYVPKKKTRMVTKLSTKYSIRLKCLFPTGASTNWPQIGLKILTIIKFIGNFVRKFEIGILTDST